MMSESQKKKKNKFALGNQISRPKNVEKLLFLVNLRLGNQPPNTRNNVTKVPRKGIKVLLRTM